MRKLLIVDAPNFYAASEYLENGQPTKNTAPILRKILRGRTLEQAIKFFSHWNNVTVILRDIEDEAKNEGATSLQV